VKIEAAWLIQLGPDLRSEAANDDVFDVPEEDGGVEERLSRGPHKPEHAG
jgi:hypothetical protein